MDEIEKKKCSEAAAYLEKLPKLDYEIFKLLHEAEQWEKRANSVGDIIIYHDSAKMAAETAKKYRETAAALKKERQEILDVIAQLQSDEAEVIWQIYILHQTKKKVIEVMGRSYIWVRMRKERGLLKISDILEERKKKNKEE